MVDKTMMGDKCAELVRAAMIGALAVTLGNPTAVYAAEEETADPGQIGIEIAGEAAVGAASFCVEEDAAEEAPAEAEEVTESEGTQNDEMEEERGSEGKEDETVPEEPEPQEPDGGENAGMTEPGKTGETEPEGPENAEPGEAGETESEKPENPEPGDQGDMPETPGNSEMDGPWPGEGEDISNDPWPGQEEIGGGDGEQMEPPEEENGSAGSDDATGGDKTAEVSSDSDLSQSAEPPAAEAEPVFSAEQEAERTRESYSEWQAAEAEKVTISRMPWLFHTVEKTYAIADVNSWLHVREGKGTNQKIVGILPKGSLCYILADADSDWVYVESGDVRGFVCARYLLRGEEAEKEVNRWQEESFPMAEMWVKPWNNKAYTYTYATTRTLLSSDEARGEVLQYAKKFLGNPYVWGGTSLTNGCDCSGFAQQIFANFGYTLPRTSRQQAKAGTRIPVQEAKPGDLLFYQRESGFIYHVMIYLGDGKVIHAGSEATGILISDFNYEKSTEFAVRVISEEMRESKIETGDVDNGRKEENSVDNQTTENGNGGKQKAGAENVQNTSAENSTAGDRLESASGKYLGNFKLTAYCNCAVCCGRWAGGPTASGKMPVQGRTIATGVLPFGTKLNIGGKIYTVEDRGTPYGHIDIYMERHADAEEFGVRYADVYQSEEI
ncbi:MAG: NlpC/P60 family protein [Fusicatenibacter saccharivorans]|uniref:NlpC/P60 family protein n=1 Tax=Fusicatenibacter saccharivorans TaxID=1150298 RepID=UPI002A881339|nr:NlpC/P60 family protein [Fusicatenibacter saccharivorans]